MRASISTTRQPIPRRPVEPPLTICGYPRRGGGAAWGSQCMSMQAGQPSSILIAALEHAPTGIAVLGEHGAIEWVNRRLARMLRRDAADLVGSSLGELMHPDDHQPAELEAEGLSDGRFRDCGRKRFRRPDDTTVWAGLIVSPLPTGDDSRPSHLVANIAELTELVRAEERLALDRRRSRRRHRLDRSAGPDRRGQPGRRADPRSARGAARRDEPRRCAVGGRRRGRRTAATRGSPRAHGARLRRPCLRHRRAAP